MPPEIINYIYEFVGDECNCCLKKFKHPNEIKHMFIYNMHNYPAKIYLYCSKECQLFLN